MSRTNKAGLNRRSLLKVLSCSGCAVAAASMGGCTIAEVFGGGAGELAFDVSESEFAALAEINGAAPVDLAGRKILLIRTKTDEIVALSRLCTHVNCDMSPRLDGIWDGEHLTCTCHDSKFDITGKVLQGPATRDLSTYAVTFDAATGQGTLTVGTEPEPEPENPVPEPYRDRTNPFAADDPGALGAGELLWNSNCAGCHGDGRVNFGDPKPTDFTQDTSGYADDFLFWRVRTGAATGPEGSIMSTYDEATLSDDQVWQVLTYLRSLGQ
jgi:Rieske Fe-S protein